MRVSLTKNARLGGVDARRRWYIGPLVGAGGRRGPPPNRTYREQDAVQWLRLVVVADTVQFRHTPGVQGVTVYLRDLRAISDFAERARRAATPSDIYNI